MKEIRVGVIGLGNMGKVHMMNCQYIDSVKVVAAADSSKRALNRASTLGVNGLYTNYEDLFKHSSDMDCVIISLPNFLHFDCIRLALEAGLDVFVEKPLAKKLNECERIVELERKNSCHLMVGHQLRFYNPIEEIKQIINEGHIGTIEAVTLEEVTNGPFSHPAVPTPVAEWWFDEQKVGGGALLDIGCHMIDLWQFLVGDSDLLFSKLDYNYHLPVEDGAILILRSSKSQANGIVNVGWYSMQGFGKLDLRVILHGNAGFVSSDDLIGGVYKNAAKAVMGNLFKKMTGRKIKPLAYAPIWEAHYKALSHFFDCVRQDIEPTIGTSATQALKTVEIIEKAYNNKPNIK